MDKMVCHINNMSDENHKEIFLLIKKHNIEFMENNNGVFINMKNVSDECIKEIQGYINFVKENKTKVLEFEKIREDSIHKLNTNSI